MSDTPLMQLRLDGTLHGGRSFLKWAGGKSRILPSIVKLVPSDFVNYFEPFLGGGALFFRLAPQHAVLSDLNSELMECYRIVRDQPLELIEALSQMGELPWESSTYYKI